MSNEKMSYSDGRTYSDYDRLKVISGRNDPLRVISDQMNKSGIAPMPNLVGNNSIDTSAVPPMPNPNFNDEPDFAIDENGEIIRKTR